MTRAHLSTALVLLVLSVVFLLLNVPGDATLAVDEGDPGRFYLREFYLHGWPLEYLRRETPVSYTRFTPPLGSCWELWQRVVVFRPLALIVNSVFAFGVLVGVAIAFESSRGMRLRRLQFRLGTLILLIAAMAYLLAGYRNRQSAVHRMDELRSKGGDLGFYSDQQAGGPTWFRELVGGEVLMPFDYPVGIFMRGSELGMVGPIANDAMYLHVEDLTPEQASTFKNWPELRILSLSGATIEDADAPSLASGEIEQSLEERYGAATAKLIRQLRIAPQIQGIDFADTYFSDAGAVELERLPQLVALNLQDTLITDRALDSLSQLKRLRYLDLRNTEITRDAALRLAKQLPAISELYIEKENLVAQ